jgi:hypothetical protein
MSWVKNGLNGAAVVASGNSISATLTAVPTSPSVVMLLVCMTGSGMSWTYPSDDFGGGGSWVLGQAQGATDQFGNLISFLTFTKVISGAATGRTATFTQGGTPGRLGMIVTCFKPSEAADNVIRTAGLPQGSGQNSAPTATPLSWPVQENALTFSCVWYDVSTQIYPASSVFELMASAASSTPQVGVLSASASTLTNDGAGSIAWAQSVPNWLLQSWQFYYTPAAGPPVVTLNPSITGTPQVGVASSYSPGTAGANGGTTPTVTSQRWYVDGVQVATTATYTPVGGDAGKSLTVQVTWTNSEGDTLVNSPGKTVAGAAPPPPAPSAAWFTYVADQGGV